MNIKFFPMLLLAMSSVFAGPNASAPVYIDMNPSLAGIQSAIDISDTSTPFSVAIVAQNVVDLMGCEFTVKIDTSKYRIVESAFGSAFNTAPGNIWASDSSWVKFTYARMGMTPQFLSSSEAQLGTVKLKSRIGFGESAQIQILSGKFAAAGMEYDDFTGITSGAFTVKRSQCVITIVTDQGGSVSRTSMSMDYNTESAPITATPDACHTFKSWEIAIGAITVTSPTSATTTVKALGNGQIRATYTIAAQYTLTVNNDGNGTAAGSGSFDCGVSPAIQATPKTGYVFSNWTVTSGSATFANANAASTTVTLTGPATVTAHFAAIPYTLTVTAQGNGTVTPAGANTVRNGDSLQVSAQAAAGYAFVNWTVTAGASNAAVRTPSERTTWIVVTGSATVQAHFSAAVGVASRTKAPAAFDFSVSAGVVSYAVPPGKKSRVTVRVTDMNGKTVASRVQRAEAAGFYSLDLTNAKQGCYVCSMKAEEFDKTVRIILVK